MKQETNPVRQVQRHLRQAGALLAEQDFDAALREIDAALVIDPASLPAQALQQRIAIARARCAARVDAPSTTTVRLTPDPILTDPDPTTTKPDDAGPKSAGARFVPSGVDAQSWLGFEARIQERRYRALVAAINTAIVNGDGFAARAALAEARELRPNALDLPSLEARVAMVPLAIPVSDVPPTMWSRAFGAVAMLLVGIALLVGIDWWRPSAPPEQQAAITVPVPSQPQPTPDLRAATPLGAAPVTTAAPAAATTVSPPPAASEVAVNREPESIGTIGVQRVAADDTASRPPARVTAVEESGTAAAPRPSFRAAPVHDTAVPADGEIPDDYVAPASRREGSVVAGSTGTATAPPLGAPASATPFASVLRQPTSVVNPPVVAATSPVSTTVPASPRADESRVAQVLDRYARAYGDLDASAAHAVWPSVDERALARAFSNLAAQSVSFDNCDINVSGTTANASCRGRASYVAKVGSREPRSEARTWNFELRREGDGWTIQNAQARRVDQR